MVIVVVVLALLTRCPAVFELPLKFESPGYISVIVFTPGAVLASMQLVAGKTAKHILPVPSSIVTVPVGAVGEAEPGAVTFKVKPTV